MYVKNQKSQNQQMSYFSPLCQLQLTISEVGLCDLFPVLLESITNSGVYVTGGALTYGSDGDVRTRPPK